MKDRNGVEITTGAKCVLMKHDSRKKVGMIGWVHEVSERSMDNPRCVQFVDMPPSKGSVLTSDDWTFASWVEPSWITVVGGAA